MTTTTFTISKQALVSTMATLSRVVQKRNTSPILSHVRLVLDGQSLTATATDLDIEARVTVTVKAAQKGQACVPAGILTDISRKFVDGAEISLAWGEGAQVKLTSGRSRLMLQQLPPEDFPDLSTGELPTRFVIGAEALGLLLGKVAHAISTEETRYYLNGVYLHAGADKIIAVATDGHRLARMTAEAPEDCAGMPGIIIPRKTVAEMLALLKGREGDVRVEVSPQKIRFTLGAITLTSKLIDGTFPDYERIIPRNNQNHTLLKVKDFAEAVERVAVISHEKQRGLKLEIGGTTLKLAMRNTDAGEAEEELEVSHRGDPVTIGFNSAYVADALATLGGEEMTLSISDAGSPALATTDTTPGLTLVLMPRRV